MFRFKSGTFQFVLLFIYIQNKQKTHERKRGTFIKYYKISQLIHTQSIAN